ncbi:hypothetical protein N9L66_05210 [Porticoccaceae bacterium]|nr:hypothetical protein [Porticoccaceae bacterium]MDA8664341.1 hypothetical protein [Porticoccaceae bacterium]MDA8682264.1 hypothetical protein [Porticoccaceae bacterium]MDA8788880.1 hypothetical protein [Porticoccaceae bacterium]MDB2343791.1 hypothetical protein [Porticoccaceae bacterium]
MRVLKDKEIDRLLGWQQEFNALNSVVRVSSESEFSLAMAQLRYLLDDRVGVQAESWSLARLLFSSLVAYRRAQTTDLETELPPTWSSMALCTLMKVKMLKTVDFKGSPGLGNTVVAGLRHSRKMTVDHMHSLSEVLGVPASWFIEDTVQQESCSLPGAFPAHRRAG